MRRLGERDVARVGGLAAAQQRRDEAVARIGGIGVASERTAKPFLRVGIAAPFEVDASDPRARIGVLRRERRDHLIRGDRIGALAEPCVCDREVLEHVGVWRERTQKVAQLGV